MKWKAVEQFSVVHNYLDDTGILRKGAISAMRGEKVVIPANMKEGIILGIGKGNEEWNYSAPHGSGRRFKREDVKSQYTVSEFKKEMKYSDFIFLAKTGRALMPSAVNNVIYNVVDKYNKEEVARAKKEHRKAEFLPRISAHNLRHTACTNMAKKGMNVKVLQYLMGHAHSDAIMDVYNHIANKQDIFNKIISTHLLTVLTKCVIVISSLEQIKQNDI